ncbi:MAG: extracellular solute-binding protein [Anaerolineales bacterium]|nr:MAG: extracellular solute-binding protein [Anaerolineales bacterium]
MSAKKLSRRDFLRITALGSVGLALAACGPKDSGGGGTTDVPADASGKLVWYAAQAADHLPPFKSQHETWNEIYPNVEIEEVFVPWSDYSTKMNTMIGGGETIDVVWVMIDNGQGDALGIDTWIGRDALIDFTPVFDASEMKREDYFQGVLENHFKIDGKFWGAPFECWQAVFWYNITLFNEAGIDIPNENWMWADYNSAAAALTKKNGDNVDQMGTRCATWDTFVYQAGGQILSDDKKSISLDSDAAMEGFKEWYYFTSNGYSPVGDESNVFGGLQSGKIATHSDGNYMWTSFREVSADLGFDFGATLAPAGPASGSMSKANRGGYNVWAAFKSTKYPELAQKFVTHLGYGTGAEFWAATGRVSPLKRFDLDYYQEVANLTADEKVRYATDLNATFTQLDKNYLHANTVAPDVPNTSWGTIATPYNEELDKVILDKSQTLEEALDIAYQRVLKGIEDAGA